MSYAANAARKRLRYVLAGYGRRAFVHRYMWSHDDLRKLFRRALRDGHLMLVTENANGWLYAAAPKKKYDDKEEADELPEH